MADTQTYQNHVRRLPPHYIGMFLILTANVLWSGYRMVGTLSVDSILAFLVSVALIILTFAARTQALTVQNRVIRLEERLRHRELLQADVAARVAQLPIDQVVALRFASDAELASLVNEVLAGSVTGAKEIKLRVKEWRADLLRA